MEMLLKHIVEIKLLVEIKLPEVLLLASSLLEILNPFFPVSVVRLAGVRVLQSLVSIHYLCVMPIFSNLVMRYSLALSGFCLFLSGWYFNDSFLNAFLSTTSSAFLSTPRIL